MPMAIHPHIRALQEAMEAAFIIPVLNTPASLLQKANEQAGIVIKQVPKIVVYSAGKPYIPS